MSVDTVVMALRNAVAIDKNGINHVADLLEQLQAENERLKASEQLGMYPIVKERHRGGFEQSICEECGHISTKDHRYIEKDYWICPVCGKSVDGLFRNYCDNCGQKLERRDAE